MVDAIVELPGSLLLGFGLILFPGGTSFVPCFFCVQSGGHFGLEPPFRSAVSGCLVFD